MVAKDPDPDLDDDGPLDLDLENDALSKGDGGVDDDATPICMRCFAPLAGAPTNCANCGAAASRAAMLGPAVSGGVDLGGTTVGALPKEADGHVGAWGVAIVWGLGMILIPMLISLFLVVAEWSRDTSYGGPGLLLALLALWTAVCALLIDRRLRLARRAVKTDRGAPDAF